MVGNLIDELSGLLIKANTKQAFQEHLQAGNILNNSIVFILDTQEIWTQGQYWPCPYSKDQIDTLFSKVNDNINQVRALHSEISSNLTQYQHTTNQLILEKEQSALQALAAEVARASEQESKLAASVSQLSQGLTTESGRATAAEESLRNTKVDKEEGKSLVSDVQITKLTDLNDQATITSNIADAKKAGTDAQASINLHTSNTSNPHGVTKAQVGLGNVDNTSDTDKPISTATQTALNNKVDKVSGKGLSTNDYTSDEKTKLGSIEVGANKTIVDAVLSDTSTNPVQNKVVKGSVDEINTKISWLTIE